MYLVPLEMLANAIGPGEQVEDILSAFKVEQPPAFFRGDVSAPQHSPAQVRQADLMAGVNQFSAHG